MADLTAGLFTHRGLIRHHDYLYTESYLFDIRTIYTHRVDHTAGLFIHRELGDKAQKNIVKTNDNNQGCKENMVRK